MNYFKPELLTRCRSLDDDVADAAAKEWENAILAYHTRLQTIRRGLPSGARGLLSRVTLHDAKVLTVTLARKRPSQIRCQLRAAQPDHPSNQDIAAEMDCNRHTVGQWRERFVARGLPDLQDAPRDGHFEVERAYESLPADGVDGMERSQSFEL